MNIKRKYKLKNGNKVCKNEILKKRKEKKKKSERKENMKKLKRYKSIKNK
jgi:hypothetical protein